MLDSLDKTPEIVTALLKMDPEGELKLLIADQITNDGPL
jgi:hypothetical protein